VPVIPDAWEAEIGKIMAPGAVRVRKKVCGTPISTEKILDVVTHACYSSSKRGCKIGES
jgi:hypothetical protein